MWRKRMSKIQVQRRRFRICKYEMNRGFACLLPWPYSSPPPNPNHIEYKFHHRHHRYRLSRGHDDPPANKPRPPQSETNPPIRRRSISLHRRRHIRRCTPSISSATNRHDLRPIGVSRAGEAEKAGGARSSFPPLQLAASDGGFARWDLIRTAHESHNPS